MEVKEKRFAFNQSRCIAIGFGAVFCLALLVLVVSGLHGVKASPASPIPVAFEGEYSQNGSEWQPLTEDTRVNALEGDLLLRGSFDYGDVDTIIHVFLDNISLTILSGGEEVYSFQNDSEGPPGTYGALWIGWRSTLFSGEDVEVLLSNSLSIGNPNAYNDFLHRLYLGPSQAFENYILYPSDYFSGNLEYEGAELVGQFLCSGQFWRALGASVFFAALILFGLALADRLQSRLFGRKLWLLGALSVFAMGIMVLDTPDSGLWHIASVLDTSGAQLCRMLWMLTLSLFAAEFLTGRRRLAAYAASVAGGVLDAVLLLIAILGGGAVTDTVAVWAAAQAHQY